MIGATTGREDWWWISVGELLADVDVVATGEVSTSPTCLDFSPVFSDLILKDAITLIMSTDAVALFTCVVRF